MNKKGFTLIELLAVIIILAIIATIVVPIVLNIINTTKDNSILRSGDFYLDSVKQTIMEKSLDANIDFNPNECTIKSDGNLTCDIGDLDIVVEGKDRPTGGVIIFDNGVITAATIIFKDNKIVMLNNEGEFVLMDSEEQLPDPTPLSDFTYYLGSEYSVVDRLENFNGVYEHALIPISLAENEVLLTKYNGESTDVIVPDTYVVDGVTYNVVLLSYSSDDRVILDIDSYEVYRDDSSETGTFYNNEGIESVILSKNIKFLYSLRYNEYDDASGVRTDSTESLKENNATKLFAGCVNLKNVIFLGNIATLNSTFDGCTNLTSVTLPTSIENIGSYTFSNCVNLTNITIPTSVKSIGAYAFKGSGLTSVTIPSSVTSMGSAFSGSENLTDVKIQDGAVRIEDNAFYGCTSLKNVTIPSSVKSIGYKAFYGCTSLKNVTIPNSVTSIGSLAFLDCTSLESIKIPNSITSISYGAFYGCTGLKNVTIPNSVTSIDDYAFRNCTSLTSVTIPNSVTSINVRAFNGCSSLTTIYYSGTATGATWGATNATVKAE